MTYYTLLGLSQEPFSNSPDPDLLYRSPAAARCLQELEIAVRLHRGLNVVFGQVGTGKTTMCRELLRQLYNDPHIETFLILDPGYSSQLEFIRALGTTLGLSQPEDAGLQASKDNVQNWLLTRVNEQGQTVVLLIDEGQKIRDDCLEILRELLNFETNTAKLLQIVLFAQTELKPRMEAVPNLIDRINFRYELRPLNLAETRAMIEYRLAKCRREDSQPTRLTRPAAWTIYHSTRGYPRKIIHCCHHTLIIMASRQSQTMRRRWVRQHLKEQPTGSRLGLRHLGYGALGTGLLAFLAVILFSWDQSFNGSQTNEPKDLPGLESPQNNRIDRTTGHKEQPIVDISAHGSNQDSIQDANNERRGPEGHPSLSNASDHGSQKAAQQKPSGWPQELGIIHLPPRDSIWNISCVVYNTQKNITHTRVILPAIRQANPELPNLDRLSPTTPVHFPVLPVMASLAPQQCRLSLFHTMDLRTAYDRFNQITDLLSSNAARPCFLALWDHRAGLRFHIVAGKIFQSPVQAERAMEKLPGSLRDTSTIMDWTDNNIRPICLSNVSHH